MTTLDKAKTQFAIINQLIDAGKYEEAIAKSGEALQDAIQLTHDEMSPLLIDFYLHYADTIIKKTMASDDLFAQPVKNAIQDASRIRTSKQQEEGKSPSKAIDHLMNKPKNKEANDSDSYSDDENEVAKEPEDDDDQIIWENLEIARVIASKQSGIYKLDTPEYEKYADVLADIHMKEASFLSMNEEYTKAVEECQKCAEIQMRDPTSRKLAEAYFMMGIYSSNIMGSEKNALSYLHFSRKILEAALAKLQKKEYKPIEIVDYENVVIYPTDCLEIKDLKDVLKELYEKIQDTQTQKEELPELKKEAQQEKPAETEKFDAPKINTETKDLGLLSKRKQDSTLDDRQSKLVKKDE